MASLLELKQVSVTYPNAVLGLDGVDLTLERGEIVLVAGATGSGKSTLAMRLLNVIPQQVKADCCGEIFFDQIPTEGLAPHRLAQRMQLVLQNPEAMLFSLTVEDNLRFGLENLCWEREKILARTEEMLRLFRLAPLRRRSPLELSGGEQQSAALAGVLSADPSLFILDEPLTYLDPAGKKELIGHLQELKLAGKGILLLEHRLDLAQEIADRVVILREGKKVLDSPARSVPIQSFKKEMGLRSEMVIASPRRGRSNLHGDCFVALRAPRNDISEALRFDNVSFSYTNGKEKIPALKKVTFQVLQGEIAALLGPNGSGKSTLASCAAGLETPAEGEIWIQGQPASKLSAVARARGLGLMFQRPEVQLFCRTVREELEFGARNIRLPAAEREERVRDVAEGLKLAPLLDRHPATLSRGEMRRLALGSLLVMRPSVLILDEPSVGQDYAHLELIGRHLRTLNQAGHTILLITHDEEFARSLASRIFTMENGEMKNDAAVEPVSHF